MKDFLDGLYTSYLYRDIVSYFLPGVLAALALLAAMMGGRLPRASLRTSSPSTLLVAALAAYAVGLFLQAAGTYHYDDQNWRGLKFYATPADLRNHEALVVQDCEFNRTELLSRSAVTVPEWASKRLERLVALAQTEGNLAAAALVVALCFAVAAVLRLKPVERRVRGSAPAGRAYISPPSPVWAVAAVLSGLSACVFFHEHERMRVKQLVFTQLMKVMEAEPEAPAEASVAPTPVGTEAASGAATRNAVAPPGEPLTGSSGLGVGGTSTLAAPVVPGAALSSEAAAAPKPKPPDINRAGLTGFQCRVSSFPTPYEQPTAESKGPNDDGAVAPAPSARTEPAER